MLNLHAPTPQSWLPKVSANLEELLLDHAHCEKKAAGVAPASSTLARKLSAAPNRSASERSTIGRVWL